MRYAAYWLPSKISLKKSLSNSRTDTIRCCKNIASITMRLDYQKFQLERSNEYPWLTWRAKWWIVIKLFVTKHTPTVILWMRYGFCCRASLLWFFEFSVGAGTLSTKPQASIGLRWEVLSSHLTASERDANSARGTLRDRPESIGPKNPYSYTRVQSPRENRLQRTTNLPVVRSQGPEIQRLVSANPRDSGLVAPA